METTLKIRAKYIANHIQEFVGKNERVLDIGCGNGVVTSELKNILGLDIVGTDIEKYLKKNIPFVLMKSSLKLDFEDQSFNVGLFNDVLHHVNDEEQLKLIEEASRVCKRILIFEQSPSKFIFFLDRVLNRVHNKNMPLPLSHRSHSEWSHELKKMGLNCRTKFLPRFLGVMPIECFLLDVSRINH